MRILHEMKNEMQDSETGLTFSSDLYKMKRRRRRRHQKVFIKILLEESHTSQCDSDTVAVSL